MYGICTVPTRWAPTSYKLSYNPYKWPYKWVTGVITLLIGVIIQFITGRGPPCTFTNKINYSCRQNIPYMDPMGEGKSKHGNSFGTFDAGRRPMTFVFPFLIWERSEFATRRDFLFVKIWWEIHTVLFVCISIVYIYILVIHLHLRLLHMYIYSNITSLNI